MHEVREKIRHASYLSNYLSACWVFDVVTPEWIGDIARSLLVLSATTDIWGGAQSIKGFAMLKNVVHFQFASEVRPRKLFEISLRKSRLHKLHAFMEKRLGTEICCITIRVITGDYCSKSDSKGEDQGSGTVACVACRRKDSESDRLSAGRSKTQLPWFRNRCDKHHYHCSSLSFVWKSRCLYLFLYRVLLLLV